MFSLIQISDNIFEIADDMFITYGMFTEKLKVQGTLVINQNACMKGAPQFNS